MPPIDVTFEPVPKARTAKPKHYASDEWLGVVGVVMVIGMFLGILAVYG